MNIIKNDKIESCYWALLWIKVYFRSLSKVWNIGSVRYYAGKKAQGKPLPSIHKEDDPLQMGGDFTFRFLLMSFILVGNFLIFVFRCSDKSLVMSHPSKTPIDRPSISEILSVMRSWIIIFLQFYCIELQVSMKVKCPRYFQHFSEC